LRQRKYLPILFDFEKPRSRNTDETITLLARMARFVVADISDAKSVLQELRAIVPDLPSVHTGNPYFVGILRVPPITGNRLLRARTQPPQLMAAVAEELVKQYDLQMFEGDS
jgi:hypothetical protein